MLKLQFFEQIYFFHQKCFFSNGECNLDNGSKYFSLRVHTFAAQIPKTTKKTELFERKKTFLKKFLCTCKMQLWPPCRNFLVKTLKFFCWISRNEEKLISLPKKLFLKIFVWTCTTNIWQACRKAFFFEKSKLSFSSFLQKNTKIFIRIRRIQLWRPCQKISRQNSENFVLEFRKWWKFWAHSQQSCFSPKTFV